MPLLRNQYAKNLARWQLAHTAPASLSIDHPAQVDMAEASDEIERLHSALEKMAAWVRHWQMDRAHNLMPTEGALADAAALIESTLMK